MATTKSQEDYLEAMLIMRERHGYIRSVDIANELGVTKASVSVAVKQLRESDYITMQKDGLITMTEKGLNVAESVYDRHKMLIKFLVYLGVDEPTARADACKMEHDISQRTFEALKRHAAMLKD